MVQNRLDQLAVDSQIAPEVLAILRARHDYRVGRLPRNTADGLEAAFVAAELRTDLIAAERESSTGCCKTAGSPMKPADA